MPLRLRFSRGKFQFYDGHVLSDALSSAQEQAALGCIVLTLSYHFSHVSLSYTPIFVFLFSFSFLYLIPSCSAFSYFSLSYFFLQLLLYIYSRFFYRIVFVHSYQFLFLRITFLLNIIVCFTLYRLPLLLILCILSFLSYLSVSLHIFIFMVCCFLLWFIITTPSLSYETHLSLHRLRILSTTKKPILLCLFLSEILTFC